jgi:hypothetical protein
LNARQKLNSAYINGALIIAGLVGLGTGSWAVFFLLLGVLLAIALADGGIRPTPRRR